MKHTSPGSFVESSGVVTGPQGAPLAVGETVIGSYGNPPPYEAISIIFTTHALYIVEADRTERIAVDDILDYERPQSKTDITGVRLRTRDGFRFVRIAGSFGPSGRFKDAFTFINLVRGFIQ